MTTLILTVIYLWVYILIGTGVSVVAAKNTALTGDQLLRIIAVWPLVLVRYFVELIMEKVK